MISETTEGERVRHRRPVGQGRVRATPEGTQSHRSGKTKLFKVSIRRIF